MVDIARWLAEHGLGHHAAAFRENGIAGDVLRDLTEADLKELGLNLGDRKRLLKAVAALDAEPTDAPTEATDASAPPRASPAERRQLTVMFADLAGSTELSHRLDPEDFRELLRAYHTTVAGLIVGHEGHVAKHLGDGVLAYWGWPRAQEDAAERAVRSGLALTDAVARLGRAPGAPVLQVRVGIATGLVVVGDLVGEGAVRDEVVGETPNLAARLQAQAEPGTVVIAATTRRLIRSVFTCEALRARRLRGFPVPVPVWRVIGEAPASSAPQPRRAAGFAPLVGREAELAQLIESWERAKAGQGQTVLLTGEAGIGKSRCVEALRERLVAEEHVERHYACLPLHKTSTLHPVLAQLAHAAGLHRADPPEQKLARLVAALDLPDAQAGETLAPVVELLGIPTGGPRPGEEAGALRRKARTLELLVGQMLRCPPDQPLLLVFEDVYWADPTSLELLGLLVERVRTQPALLVVTTRPGFWPAWSAWAHVRELPIERLSRTEAAQLAAAAADGGVLPPELLEQILDRADGIPLFVEELVRAVLEVGLASPEPRDHLPAGPAPAVPATLRDGLMARLDRLGRARQVAEVGAALGQRFSLELLAAVLPWPAAELEEALAALLAAGLLRKAAADARPSYVFKHALVREVAYETLLRERRRELHARVADVLEHQFPGTPPELLAQHHARSGATWQAVRCWLDAGEQSLRQSAPAEAIAQLSAGLELLRELPEDTERHRWEARLHLALGQALSLAKGRAAPEVGHAFGRAWELGRHGEPTADLGAALLGLYGFYFHRAELNEARAAAEELLHLAEWQGDAAGRAAALGIGGAIAFFLGRLPAARSSLEAALADGTLAQHRSFTAYGLDPRQLALGYLSWTVLVLGHPEEARRRSNQAVAEAEALPQQPAPLAASLFAACVVHQLRREPEAVRARAERLAVLAGEQGFPLWRAGAAVLQGWSAVDEGDPDGALRQMRRGLAAWRTTGAEHLVPYFQALLAEACGRAGRPAEGLRLLEDGLARAERTGERWCEAELLRLRGELLLLRAGRNRAKAEACLRRAHALADRQGARLLALRALVSAARLRANSGGGRGVASIRRLLAAAYEGFTEGLDTPDLIEAEQLLAASV
jgi:class 3 adenylate cyclase/predicted ATPase